MPARISDYALIGDMQSAALVGRDGSIDWLCLPRFDSDACFAALLGDRRHGYWQIAPTAPVCEVRRRYRPDTLIVETEHVTETGVLRVTDCMPPRGREPDVVRIAECVAGTVQVRMKLVARFGYGKRRPWIRLDGGCVQLTTAPDALAFWAEVPVRIENASLVAELVLGCGERCAFRIAWHPAHEPPPPVADANAMVAHADTWWRRWTARSTYDGPWRDAVRRSLITLKALTYAPTGGLVAAPTTSLPERLGGVRNWDYRFCWLRDATLTLYALLDGGFIEAATEFNHWLERAARGEPSRLQVLYGVAGERRLTELELPWLPGHRGSAPVRIGNAAHEQFQLDIYGELVDCVHHARTHGVPTDPDIWALHCELLAYLARVWREPDEGIWEVRGPRRHFTHSKVMVWVAFDRMIKDAVRFGLSAPLAQWRAIRDEIHAEVCTHGFDCGRDTFTQAYGHPELDASLLLIPLVGFLPPSDPRVRGTITAIRRGLERNGLVLRYNSAHTDDGLPVGEGAFLPCSFWLADNLHLQGRRDEALALFERLLAARNEVGLLAEELEPFTGEQLGNFPQEFSHVPLVNSWIHLSGVCDEALRRARE